MQKPISDAQHYSGVKAIQTLVRAHDAIPGTRNAMSMTPNVVPDVKPAAKTQKPAMAGARTPGMGSKGPKGY